jgi:hypothetical protein
MDKKSLITIRSYKPDDYNFILATWLRGLYYGNDWFGKIPKEIYMDRYHKVIDAILRKPTIQASLAVLLEDPDVILGYSIYEPDILHWVYVKTAWRRIGIAKDIVPRGTNTVTHLTKIGDQIRKQMEFNPFLEGL